MGTRDLNLLVVEDDDWNGTSPYDRGNNVVGFVQTHLGAELVAKQDGFSMYEFETNFQPMWARDKSGGTSDLQREADLHRLLDQRSPVCNFILLRVGESGADRRGLMKTHPFENHPRYVELLHEYNSQISGATEASETNSRFDQYVKSLEDLCSIISDTVQGGRLKETDIPDDYRALVEQMAKCNAIRADLDSKPHAISTNFHGDQPVSLDPHVEAAITKLTYNEAQDLLDEHCGVGCHDEHDLEEMQDKVRSAVLHGTIPASELLSETSPQTPRMRA